MRVVGALSGVPSPSLDSRPYEASFGRPLNDPIPGGAAPAAAAAAPR